MVYRILLVNMAAGCQGSCSLTERWTLDVISACTSNTYYCCSSWLFCIPSGSRNNFSALQDIHLFVKKQFLERSRWCRWTCSVICIWHSSSSTFGPAEHIAKSRGQILEVNVQPHFGPALTVDYGVDPSQEMKRKDDSLIADPCLVCSHFLRCLFTNLPNVVEKFICYENLQVQICGKSKCFLCIDDQ